MKNYVSGMRLVQILRDEFHGYDAHSVSAGLAGRRDRRRRGIAACFGFRCRLRCDSGCGTRHRHRRGHRHRGPGRRPLSNFRAHRRDVGGAHRRRLPLRFGRRLDRFSHGRHHARPHEHLALGTTYQLHSVGCFYRFYERHCRHHLRRANRQLARHRNARGAQCRRAAVEIRAAATNTELGRSGYQLARHRHDGGLAEKLGARVPGSSSRLSRQPV